jgi:hypothetical protein
MADIEELKALYPNLSDDELAVAKETLDRYLLLVWEIMEDERMRDRPPFPNQAPEVRCKGKVDSHTN